MTGIGETAGVAGLISSAIARAQDCVKLFDLIAAARNFGTNADRLRNRFFFARLNLISWLDMLEEAGKRQSSLYNLDWRFVGDTLGQLEAMLSSAETLEKTYGFEAIDGDAEALGQTAASPPPAGNIVARALAKLRPKHKLVTSQILHDRTNAWTKTKWAFSGSTKFADLVKDIETLIQAMASLNSTVHLKFLIRQEERELSSILIGAQSSQDVETFNRVFSAEQPADKSSRPSFKTAHTLGLIKARRLQLGVDTTDQELEKHVSGLPSKTRIPPNIRLKAGEMRSRRQLDVDRDIVEYRDHNCLLEYKKIPANVREKLEDRVRALGVLLAQSETKHFRTLPCLGLFDDVGVDRYAFVFQIPSYGAESNHHDIPVWSLKQYMTSQNISPPTKSQRLRIMVEIAEAVRNFHAVGWLHKGIHSRNILFFPAASATEETFTDSCTGPFLAGFGYARAANSTEFSEIPLTSSGDDYYRHTAIVGPNPRYFRKIFDLYALGLVLLEIILWKIFPAILDNACRPEDLSGVQDDLMMVTVRDQLLQRQGTDSIMGILESSCSSACYKAIEICLADYPEDTWAPLEHSLDLQNKVVDLLDTAFSTIDNSD